MGKRPEPGTLGHNPFENLGATKQAIEMEVAEQEQAELDTKYNNVLAGRYDTVADLAGDHHGIVFDPGLANVEYAIINRPGESDQLSVTLVYKNDEGLLRTISGSIFGQKKDQSDIERPTFSIKDSDLARLGISRKEVLRSVLNHLETINLDRSIIINEEINPADEDDNKSRKKGEKEAIITQDVQSYTIKTDFFKKLPNLIAAISNKDLGLYDGKVAFLFPNYIIIEGNKYGEGAIIIVFPDGLDSARYSQMLMSGEKDKLKDEISAMPWFSYITQPRKGLRKMISQQRQTDHYPDRIIVIQKNHSYNHDKGAVKEESLKDIIQEAENTIPKVKSLMAEATS